MQGERLAGFPFMFGVLFQSGRLAYRRDIRFWLFSMLYISYSVFVTLFHYGLLLSWSVVAWKLRVLACFHSVAQKCQRCLSASRYEKGRGKKCCPEIAAISANSALFYLQGHQSPRHKTPWPHPQLTSESPHWSRPRAELECQGFQLTSGAQRPTLYKGWDCGRSGWLASPPLQVSCTFFNRGFSFLFFECLAFWSGVGPIRDYQIQWPSVGCARLDTQIWWINSISLVFSTPLCSLPFPAWASYVWQSSAASIVRPSHQLDLFTMIYVTCEPHAIPLLPVLHGHAKLASTPAHFLPDATVGTWGDVCMGHKCCRFWENLY